MHIATRTRLRTTMVLQPDPGLARARLPGPEPQEHDTLPVPHQADVNGLGAPLVNAPTTRWLTRTQVGHRSCPAQRQGHARHEPTPTQAPRVKQAHRTKGHCQDGGQGHITMPPGLQPGCPAPGDQRQGAGHQQDQTEATQPGNIASARRKTPGRRPQQRSQNGHGWGRISAGKTCTSRCRFNGDVVNQTRLKTSEPLVPPKPKLFFTATSIFISRAVLAQ